MLLSISSLAFSQGGTAFGLKGGLNFGNMDAFLLGVKLDTEFRNSFYIGGFAEFSIKEDELKIGAELSYVQNGYVINIYNSRTDTDTESTTKISQIILTTPVKFGVSEALYLYIGPYVAFNTDVESDTSITTNSTSSSRNSETTTSNKDLTNKYSSLDTGAAIGLEYNLSSGLFFDVKYNYGFIDVYDNENAADSKTLKTKPRFFQIGVGYKFL